MVGWFTVLGCGTGQDEQTTHEDMINSNCIICSSPWSRVLLEKLTGLKLVKKFPAFYGTPSSLPHSQMPATSPYPEPA